MKGMTMSNIVSGFHTTGVYLFNHSALRVSSQPKPKRVSLAEQTGLRFIPLYSPSRRSAEVNSPGTHTFSPEEVALFQHRFEEGYDIHHDKYEHWLRMYHPECNSPPSNSSPPQLDPGPPESPDSPQVGEMVSFLEHTSVLSRVLDKQAPQVKYPIKQPKASARILTSEENLQIIAEKERKKKLEEEDKERKKMEREERRLRAEEEKRRKSMLREQKQLAREEKGQQSTRRSTVKGNP